MKTPAMEFCTRAATFALTSVLVILLNAGSPARAQEAITQEEETPSSVDEILTPIERSFEEKPVKPPLLEEFKEKLKDTDPFVRDTRLGINLRTFYFRRGKYDDSVSEAWALGGSLSYRSGWYRDHFGIGAAAFTSQPLYAPDDRDGSGLLQPGQKGYTALAQIYGRVKLFEDHFVNIYRYGEFNTPYLNRHDIRMTANSFEGYTAQGTFGGEGGDAQFKYGLGYIDKIKPRTSERFISMSRQAGANVSRGVFAAGGRYTDGGFEIGAIDYFSEDIINIFYGEADYTLNISNDLGVFFAAQFTDQRSTGSDLLTGSSFKTNHFGAETAISYGGGVLTLGVTRDAKGADLRNPWGSYPGYTSVQVQDFNRAGEKAFLSKLSFDFERLGLEGVTAFALFVHGWGRVDPSTGQDIPDENEADFDLQWKPKSGPLKNFWPRLRYAVVRQYEGDKQSIHDFRIIVNYDANFL